MKLIVRMFAGFLISFISTGGALAFDGEDVIESLRDNEGLNYVFDINALPTVTLEVSVGEWNKQLIYFDVNPRHEEYVKANFIFEKNGKTERLKNIGFRIKGGRFSRKRPEGVIGTFHNSQNPEWHKAHFNLNFKKYKKKKRFHGLRGLSMRFIKGDPMYVRELYGYDLAKRFGIGMMHYASLAKLYIKIEGDAKPAYFGIYYINEKLGRGYLERRFPDEHKQGNLWKNLWVRTGETANLRPESFIPTKVGKEAISLHEAGSFRPVYDLKTSKAGIEKASAQYRQFIVDLNTKLGDDFIDWIESAFDVDQFLKTIAINSLLGIWDNYWASANNYYFYFDAEGRGYYIPYDFDNDLGTSIYFENTGSQDIMTFGPMNNSRPLVFKILTVPKFRKKYKTYIKELIDPANDYFDFKASVARIEKWQSLIKDHTIDDTGEMEDLADLTAPWSNTPFYRLLSGNASGTAPEANWFKTRSTFALKQIKADRGWKKPVTPKNVVLFLKGKFNKWSSKGAYRFGYKNSIYTLDVYLTKDTKYKFVIADKEMNPTTYFGASIQDKKIILGKPLRLYRKSTNPILSDAKLFIEETGTYRFQFDISDEVNPALLVNLNAPETSGTPSAQ